MKNVALAVMLTLTPAQWAPGATPVVDATPYHTITMKICSGWRAWRSGDNLVVVCPGYAPPAGAIQLREYYQLAP